MFIRIRCAALLFVVTTAGLRATLGCDVCGCYTPQIDALPHTSPDAPFGQRSPSSDAESSWLSRAYFAIAEQFTHFGTLQLDGRKVENATGQYLDSSITQLVAGYNLTPRVSFQVNLPLIYRSFERPEAFAADHGTEAGLGDISLLGQFILLQREAGGRRALDLSDPKNPRLETHEPDFALIALLVGGVKFPTGGTARLKEEFNELEIPGTPASGIHGHDLTLGTGSYDGIIGGQTSLRYKSFFFQADTLFTLRGDGAHQYHFADELWWSGGPGYYFIRSRKTVVGLQCACAGEHKGVDRFRGNAAEDTGITSVFLGPRMLASYGKLSGALAAELPVLIENTSLQAVPDYRLRASFAVSF